MTIQPIAKIAHHVLADAVVQIGLSNADDPRHNGCQEHDHDIDDEQADIALADSIIKDTLDQERIHQPQQRRHDNSRQHQNDLQFVWTEGFCDSFHRAYIRLAPTLLLILYNISHRTMSAVPAAHSMNCHIWHSLIYFTLCIMSLIKSLSSGFLNRIADKRSSVL